MKLYYDESFSPRKACAVAQHLQIPLDYRRVRLARGEHRSPEFLAINPNGRLPVLQDGEFALWEANAIMCYLSEKAGADLWPHDAAGQVEVQRWFSWDASHFSRHGGNLYFEHLIKPALGLGKPDTHAVVEAERQFMASAAVLDAHLAGRRFLLGDRLSVADFAVSAALPYSDAAKLPLLDFPAIQRWHSRLEELPGWRDPFPA